MGLLDSVLGAVMNSGQQQPVDQGASGTGTGGLGGLIGLVASNPQLLQIVAGMLSNGSAQGGLGGLIGKFQQAGLGDAISSWIGNGPNQHVSPDQLSHVLGAGTIGDIAERLGLSHGEAAGQLSQLLPQVLNHLTPAGEAPEGGLGGTGDLMGMLGGLLKR